MINKKQQTIDTYNRTASAMAQKFKAIGARASDIDKAFSLVHTLNPTVLEIGCGDGRDAAIILQLTPNYLGIDISYSMIEIARSAAPQGKFEVADAEAYNFPTNLDIIFAFASLLHSDKSQVKNILNQAALVLNPGGIFYISLKHDQYQEKAKTDEFGTRTFYFYTPEDLIEIKPSSLIEVYRDYQDLRGQKWFTLALQKQPS